MQEETEIEHCRLLFALSAAIDKSRRSHCAVNANTDRYIRCESMPGLANRRARSIADRVEVVIDRATGNFARPRKSFLKTRKSHTDAERAEVRQNANTFRYIFRNE